MAGDEQQGTRTYKVEIDDLYGLDNIAVFNNYPLLRAGQTVTFTLRRPYEEVVAEQAQNGATRSASACPGAVDAGAHWHCHGDAVYHQHGPEWSYRHPAPGQAVRTTPDPNPVAPAPATEPSSAADKAKGFGDWHTHPDGRFHRHG